MSRARVFWELDWDGCERTREGAFREARRRMRAGKTVILEQVWVWGPREGFPNGKRFHVGRWEAYNGELFCSYRFTASWRCSVRGNPFANYRKWSRSAAETW